MLLSRRLFFLTFKLITKTIVNVFLKNHFLNVFFEERTHKLCEKLIVLWNTQLTYLPD